jgi:hypothetical protein
MISFLSRCHFYLGFAADVNLDITFQALTRYREL